MEILKSIYEKRDPFWKMGGRFVNYSSQASMEFVLIKMKEYLNGKSKYSINTIRNIIANDKKLIYSDNSIFEIRKFKKSGEEARIEYPHFPIGKYLDELDGTLKAYSKQIQAISDLRDNELAHIGERKAPDSGKEITYCNIKRIYSSLLIIYDGFLFSVAPDLYRNYKVDYQMAFPILNQACKVYEKNCEDNEKRINCISKH